MRIGLSSATDVEFGPANKDLGAAGAFVVAGRRRSSPIVGANPLGTPIAGLFFLESGKAHRKP
jgi:hypothetical protein